MENNVKCELGSGDRIASKNKVSSKERFKELADRLTGQTKTGNGIEVMLLEYWKTAAGAIAITFIVIWLFGEFRAGKQQHIAEAAQHFASAQEAYNKIGSTDENGASENSSEVDTGAQGSVDRGSVDKGSIAKKEEQKKKQEEEVQIFNDSVSVVETAYHNTVYARLTKLYQAKRKLDLADNTAALEILSGVQGSKFLVATSVINPSEVDPVGLVDELEALLYARALLPTRIDEARVVLQGLIRSAQFVNAEAAIALYRTAETDQQRVDAAILVKELVAARPEYSEILKAPFGEMDVSL